MHDIETHKTMRKAITGGNLEELKRLINDDRSRLGMITPFGTWLHVAAAHGQLEIARWLVSQGMDVNAPGQTIEGAPLDQAASRGHLEVAKYLIDAGAELDISEPTRNPLFGAIYGGHVAIARMLVDRGIDTTVAYTGEHMHGMDALAFAKEYGRGEIVELLEQKHRQTRA